MEKRFYTFQSVCLVISFFLFSCTQTGIVFNSSIEDGGGVTPFPGLTPSAACKKSPKFERLAQRLTLSEYENSVKELTGFLDVNEKGFLVDSTSNKFSNFPEDLIVSEDLMNYFSKYSKKAAAAYLKNKLSCNPSDESCVLNEISELAQIAWRKNNSQSEVANKIQTIFSEIKKDKESYENQSEQLTGLIQYVFLSPSFLYKIKTSNQKSSLSKEDIAQKFSFLFFGKPATDAERAMVNDIYSNNNEKNQDGMRALMNSDKIEFFADNFFTQWLGSKEISAKQFSRKIHSETLREKMNQEVIETSKFHLQENSIIEKLVDSKNVFVDAELAQLYGLNTGSISNNQFKKIDADGGIRGGLLTTAAQMHYLGKDNTTEPLIRSLWLINDVLCSNFGSAPDGAADAPVNIPDDGSGLSKRERIERDRTTAQGCKSCHAGMDPLGFAFEKFDEKGQERDRIEGHDIDDSGEFQPQLGEKAVPFSDIKAFKKLVAHSDLYKKCFIRNLVEYTVARPLSDSETCVVDEIFNESKKDDFKIQSVIRNVIKSEAFWSAGE